MKILIIAIPRSGSSTLTNSLAKVLQYDKYHEPFNYDHPKLAQRNLPEKFPKNVIVKTLFHQLPLNANNPFDFYKNEISEYDKVIILARQDIKAAYESFNHNLITNEEGNWHLPYIYKEVNFNIDLYKNYLKWTEDIIEFSLISNIQITWYEDLFLNGNKKSIEEIKKWNIAVDTEQLINTFNNTQKYRLPYKNTLI